MQGGDLGTVNWARGTKATWKVERAVNPSLSTFKTRLQPFTQELTLSFCSIQRNRKLQRKKKGAPVSYMVAQGGWGCRGCWQEVSLAPELRRGHSPVLFSKEVIWEQEEVVLPWKTTWGEGGVAVSEDCPQGSRTLSLTQWENLVLIVSSCSSCLLV